MKRSIQKELRDLVTRYLEGGLDAPGMQRLEALLLEERGAIECYANMTGVHLDLIEHLDPAGEVTPLSLPQPVIDPRTTHTRTRSNRWIVSGGALLAAAAGWLLALGLPWTSKPAAPPIAESNQPVARVLRKIDCHWETDGWEVRPSDHIVANQKITVTSGLMEIEFASGALVTLEGPVSFTAESANRAAIIEGRLTAQVPESAKGFTVVTPAGDAVDLGTRFGIGVDRNGVTETHVFEGTVIMRPIDAPEVCLKENTALRVRGPGGKSERIGSKPQGFVQPMVLDQATPICPTIDRGLALWFAADGPLQLDENQCVVAWGDIQSATNLLVESAWQVDARHRPQWVSDAIGDLPALRFNGSQSLVTEPVSLEGAGTIAAVVRPQPKPGRDSRAVTLKSLGRQIVNMNGPPHLAMYANPEGQLTARGHLGVHPTVEGRGKNINAGEITTPGSFHDRVVAVVYTFDPAAGVSRMYVNGGEVGIGNAEAFPRTHTPRYIGSHPWHSPTGYVGDIGELMVFDVALSPIEASDLSADLMRKYRIPDGLISR